MENSKEFSTVGTFVVPTVNPSFMVGKAIKSEFGSLAQSSHKSTVKGGDKAENLRIPQKPIMNGQIINLSQSSQLGWLLHNQSAPWCGNH